MGANWWQSPFFAPAQLLPRAANCSLLDFKSEERSRENPPGGKKIGRTWELLLDCGRFRSDELVDLVGQALDSLVRRATHLGDDGADLAGRNLATPFAFTLPNRFPGFGRDQLRRDFDVDRDTARVDFFETLQRASNDVVGFRAAIKRYNAAKRSPGA